MSDELRTFLNDQQQKQGKRRASADFTAADQLKQFLIAKQLALDGERPQPDGFYSLKQVQYLTGGKSRSTIYRWSRDGILPPPRKIGPNSIGWLRSEIEAWMSKFQQGAA